jgi:hypothetical protein
VTAAPAAPVQADDDGDLQALLPRFGPAASIASHGLLTIGLGLVIRPAPVDLWLYLALGSLVGAMKVWAGRLRTGGYLLAIVAAAVVSALAGARDVPARVLAAGPGDDRADRDHRAGRRGAPRPPRRTSAPRWWPPAPSRSASWSGR